MLIFPNMKRRQLFYVLVASKRLLHLLFLILAVDTIFETIAKASFISGVITVAAFR